MQLYNQITSASDWPRLFCTLGAFVLHLILVPLSQYSYSMSIQASYLNTGPLWALYINIITTINSVIQPFLQLLLPPTPSPTFPSLHLGWPNIDEFHQTKSCRQYIAISLSCQVCLFIKPATAQHKHDQYQVRLVFQIDSKQYFSK